MVGPRGASTLVEGSCVRSASSWTLRTPVVPPEVEGVWFSTVDPRGIPTLVEGSFVRSAGQGTLYRPATLPEVEGVWFSTVDPRGIPTLVGGKLASGIGDRRPLPGVHFVAPRVEPPFPPLTAPSRGRGSLVLYGRPSGHPDLSRGIFRQVGGSGYALPTCDASRGRGSLVLYGRPSEYPDLSRGKARPELRRAVSNRPGTTTRGIQIEVPGGDSDPAKLELQESTNVLPVKPLGVQDNQDNGLSSFSANNSLILMTVILF